MAGSAVDAYAGYISSNDFPSGNTFLASSRVIAPAVIPSVYLIKSSFES